MKISLHRIITEDGLELVGILYEPEEATATVLVHVHGMAGNFYENKFLDFISETLTKNGFAFFAFNNRGCELTKNLIKVENGKQTIVRVGNAYEIFEDSIFDIKSAVDSVSGRGFRDVHLSGHSLGAPKVAHYVATGRDARIKSVIFLSPPDMVALEKKDPHAIENREAAERLLAEGKGVELTPFLTYDENRLSAETYISLTDKGSKIAIFNFHSTDDTLPLLGSIAIPALTIMGRSDDALTTSIEDAMARIQSSMKASPRVETNILGDAGHNYDGYEQQLADALSDWLNKI